MEKTKWHILSTRPLPAALVAEAATQNFVIDEVSFIETKPKVDFATSVHISKLFQKAITAVFTSANAVSAIANPSTKPKGWKIYSLDNKTARRVTEQLKTLITGMSGNAASLADLIIKNAPKEVYFFCGSIRRDDLPQKLRAANIKVEEIVVYETAETPAAITSIYDAILFYSPSAVHSFFSINKIDAATQVFAIGFTTAEAIVSYTSNPVLIADKANKEEMVKQMMMHFNKNITE